MTPRIRSFGAGAPLFARAAAPRAPKAPQVFREFVAQLEKLAGPPPKGAARPKRSPRPKAKSRKPRKR